MAFSGTGMVRGRGGGVGPAQPFDAFGTLAVLLIAAPCRLPDVSTVGDLGNVELAADGSDFSLATYDPLTTLRGKESVVGRCIAVHRNADDFSESWEPSAVLASGVVELLA